MFLSRSIVTQKNVSSLEDGGTNSGVLSGNLRGPGENVAEFKTCGEAWQPDLPNNNFGFPIHHPPVIPSLEEAIPGPIISEPWDFASLTESVKDWSDLLIYG